MGRDGLALRRAAALDRLESNDDRTLIRAR
jgi:hypothetical protein